MERRGFKTARPVARLRAGRNDWYRIENSTRSNPTEVYIYDEIGFFGVTANDFAKDFSGIKDSEITLRLNTPGGDVFDGVAIHNVIRDHKADVTAIVDGVAASAGSFIFQAGDKRIMNRHSELMIHDGWGACIGPEDEMIKMAQDLARVSNNIASIYAEIGGGTADQWRERMRAETWYSAEEAVTVGLADEVVRGAESKTVHNDFDLSIFSYGSRDEAPAPVLETDPVETVDWDALADALKGAFSE